MDDPTVDGNGFHLAQAITAARYRDEPYPHYVVADAVPVPLYRALGERLPADPCIRQDADPGDNHRFSWPAARALAAPGLDPVWRQFIAAHVSQAFLDGVLAAFAPQIRARYPLLEEHMGPLAHWRAGLRNRDGFDRAQVLLDAQICLNSPVLRQPSSVRGPHLDKPNKLFAGLFYLRPDADTDTVGGDLLIQRYRDPDARFDGSQLDPDAVATVATVPYAANTLVMFLNGPDSLHAVTPRQPSARSRYFVNLIGEVPHPLFDLSSRQRPLRSLRRLAGRVGDLVRGRRTASGQRRDSEKGLEEKGVDKKVSGTISPNPAAVDGKCP